jgi:hypothetical protein
VHGQGREGCQDAGLALLFAIARRIFHRTGRQVVGLLEDHQGPDCWRIIKASKRYIDILCGVLAGEGHLVVVQEMPNPWERKRARQYGRLSLENLKSSASPSSLAEEPDDGLHGPGDELS